MLARDLLAEQLLALVDVHVDEALAERRQLDVGVVEFGQVQELQRLAEREQIVDLELQRVGEMRQVGLAVVGRRGDLLEHAGERVGRNARQGEAEPVAAAGFARRRLGRLRPLGHQRVDLVDQVAELRVEPIARMRERDPRSRPRCGRDLTTRHEDAVAHQHRLLDVVRDHQDRL